MRCVQMVKDHSDRSLREELVENINMLVFDGDAEYHARYAPPLLIAARSCNNTQGTNSDVVKALLAARADPAGQDSTRTSLYQLRFCEACAAGDVQRVKSLFESDGAFISFEIMTALGDERVGFTPLVHAVRGSAFNAQVGGHPGSETAQQQKHAEQLELIGYLVSLRASVDYPHLDCPLNRPHPTQWQFSPRESRDSRARAPAFAVDRHR